MRGGDVHRTRAPGGPRVSRTQGRARHSRSRPCRTRRRRARPLGHGGGRQCGTAPAGHAARNLRPTRPRRRARRLPARRGAGLAQASLRDPRPVSWRGPARHRGPGDRCAAGALPAGRHRRAPQGARRWSLVPGARPRARVAPAPLRRRMDGRRDPPRPAGAGPGPVCGSLARWAGPAGLGASSRRIETPWRRSRRAARTSTRRRPGWRSFPSSTSLQRSTRTTSRCRRGNIPPCSRRSPPGRTVRGGEPRHPRIAIYGLLEARLLSPRQARPRRPRRRHLAGRREGRSLAEPADAGGDRPVAAGKADRARGP